MDNDRIASDGLSSLDQYAFNNTQRLPRIILSLQNVIKNYFAK